MFKFLIVFLLQCNYLFSVDADIADQHKIPVSLKGLEITGKAQAGGNNAVFFLKNTDGKKFVLKILPAYRLIEEILAGRIYRALGITVPINRAFYVDTANQDELPTNIDKFQRLLDLLNQNKDGKNQASTAPHKDCVLVLLSEFIDGKIFHEVIPINALKAAITITDLSAEQQKVMQEIQRGFIADCFLGNWDVCGYLDNYQGNIMIGNDQKVYRFDNGGALRYRAMGAPKRQLHGYNLDIVTEIESMRASNFGKHLYKFVSDQDIQDQIPQIVEKAQAIFKACDNLKKEINWHASDKEEIETILKNRISSLITRSLNMFKKIIKEPLNEPLDHNSINAFRKTYDLSIKSYKKSIPTEYDAVSLISLADSWQNNLINDVNNAEFISKLIQGVTLGYGFKEGVQKQLLTSEGEMKMLKNALSNAGKVLSKNSPSPNEESIWSTKKEDFSDHLSQVVEFLKKENNGKLTMNYKKAVPWY